MDDREHGGVYEILVHGEMGTASLGAFPTLTGRTHEGVTVLSGRLPDQAALFGVLDQVQSLGLRLLEVRRVS